MLRLAAFALLFSLGGVAIVGLLEERMLYPFDSHRISPKAAGLSTISEKIFETEGAKLVTWVAPPRAGKPVVLYFHGNAGNLAMRAPRFQHMLAQGYGLVAMAYRGSSGSTGSPSQKAIVSDVRALYRDLHKVLPSDAPRVLYGESLGTGVVIVGLMASEVQPRPAAVVLEAPFTSISDVALNTSPKLAPLTKFLTSPWKSLRDAKALNAPLLVIHGTDDNLIPIEQGRQIFSAAPANSKKFLAVQGAGHTNLWRSDVLQEIWRFIEASGRL
jgi:uncharacterized protein